MLTPHQLRSWCLQYRGREVLQMTDQKLSLNPIALLVNETSLNMQYKIKPAQKICNRRLNALEN